jgi:hypothetical protein
MGKKQRKARRNIDFEAVDTDADFDELTDDIYSSGWEDAWEEEWEDDDKYTARERTLRRHRLVDEWSSDDSDWDDDYRPGNW